MPKKIDGHSPLSQFRLIQYSLKSGGLPSVSLLSFEGQSPFVILVATLLSARTRDEVTLRASRQFSNVFSNARALSGADVDLVARLIFPVAFYRQKAKHLVALGTILDHRFAGKVPKTSRELQELPGVGIKTANLVLGLAFGIPAICVDTHVHRIANRLGWVATATVEDTERKLMATFPREEWIALNTVLVGFGQAICTPLSPKCSICLLGQSGDCPQIGVSQHR